MRGLLSHGTRHKKPESTLIDKFYWIGYEKPAIYERGKSALKAHEIDDGTTEAVDVQPRRRPVTTRAVEDSARTLSGGRLTQAGPTSPDQPDFITMRTQLGAVKIAISHLNVFAMFWRLWASKRGEGTDDPGVAVAELAEALQQAKQKTYVVLHTLVRNGIIRSVRTNVGWANVRASYYPTELGTQALALAQYLGPGSLVQIGRTATAWSSRSNDEPENFFRFAALLRGSATQTRRITNEP